MYYEPYDTPCAPKTWNISDDLGQIEYVFSDKTGDRSRIHDATIIVLTTFDQAL